MQSSGSQAIRCRWTASRRLPAASTYDPQMDELSACSVVAFDLDGTLLRGTRVSLLPAQRLGQAEEIAELERAFHAHEISNGLVADASAGWLAGQHTADIHPGLAEGPGSTA